MPHGRKCLVCKNTRHRDQNLRLFRFPPRDSTLWARWLQACGLTEADIDSNGGREPPRLCHRHFQPKDFLTRQLSGTAVPSISLPKVLTTEVLGGIVEPEVVEDQRQEVPEQQDHRNSKQQQQHQSQNQSAKQLNDVTNAVQDLQLGGSASSSSDGHSDLSKKLRKLRKKIREIEVIEERLRANDGPRPDKDQIEKAKRKPEILREIEELERGGGGGQK